MLRSEAGDDPERIAAVLRGVRAYQAAPRAPRPPDPPVAARAGRACLRDYAPGASGTPVVLVPSIINAATILDLDAERSLARWLAAQGFRPLLLDWGMPDAADLSIAGHVTALLLPLLAGLGQPALLVGYCLGGTMALAAAALAPVAGVATLATPWRFERYPADTRAGMAALWAEAAPAAERIGLLPIEVMQAAFWRIDPARTLDKFAVLGRAADDAVAVAGFVGVEDWANDGAPLPHAAARELFEAMLRDDAPGGGRWIVGGRTIDPAALAVPRLDLASTTDRIVPAAARPPGARRLETVLGHVGMIVGGRARAEVWEPLATWLVAQG